jgi:stage II sporulation protein D
MVLRGFASPFRHRVLWRELPRRFLGLWLGALVGCREGAGSLPLPSLPAREAGNGPLVRVQVLVAPSLRVWCDGLIVLSPAEGRGGGRILTSPLRVEARSEGLLLGEELAGGIVRLRFSKTAGQEMDGKLEGAPAVRQPLPFAIGRAESDARRYRGSLELARRGEEVIAVNEVALEEYLPGVVGAEMPAAYPLEALKAQAVAARTYALHALAAAGARQPALFESGTGFQVYGGLAAESPRVLDAVEATRGEVMTYAGRIFRAYYHSSCGGETARASLVFGEAPIPPLEGAPCGACDQGRDARWESVLPASVLEAAARRRLEAAGEEHAMGRILALEVAEIGPDGRVLYLRLEHQEGAFEWRADAFRRSVDALAPGTVRSTRFRLAPLGPDASPASGRGFRLEGSGWGHGVGLCQVGAGRLGAGADYRALLARYYPEAELARAYR